MIYLSCLLLLNGTTNARSCFLILPLLLEPLHLALSYHWYSHLIYLTLGETHLRCKNVRIQVDLRKTRYIMSERTRPWTVKLISVNLKGFRQGYPSKRKSQYQGRSPGLAIADPTISDSQPVDQMRWRLFRSAEWVWSKTNCRRCNCFCPTTQSSSR